MPAAEFTEFIQNVVRPILASEGQDRQEKADEVAQVLEAAAEGFSPAKGGKDP